MILPLKDDCYFEGKTLAIRALMGTCLLMLLATLPLLTQSGSMHSTRLESFLATWAIIPGSFNWLWIYPLLTSMFLHAGWGHLLGNMWLLHIFGDNVEGRLGSRRFLLFYLLCGVGAGLVHVAFNWGRMVPAIGASGAVSGVMGAYWVLFPKARVLGLVGGLVPMRLPANLVIFFWFAMSVVLAVLLGTGVGVAFCAHVGGFLTGMALVRGPMQPGLSDD